MKEPGLSFEVFKRVEIIAGIVLAMALVFKYVLQWPFASPMFIVGAGTLATVYAIGGQTLFKSITSETENELLLNIAGKVVALGLVGIIFKLMFWPNAMNMVIAASILLPLTIGAAIWLKTNGKTSEEGLYAKLLLRSVIVYVVVVTLYFTPISTIIAFQHRGDDELIRLKTQSYEHPENEAYRKQLNDYYKRGNSKDTIR